MKAVEFGKLDAAKELLKYGADPTTTNAVRNY